MNNNILSAHAGKTLVSVHSGNEYTMHCIKEGKTIVAKVRETKTGNVSVFDACYVNGQNIVIDYIIQSFDNLYSAAKCAQYYNRIKK